VGRAQLVRLPEIVRRRRRWAALYRELLAGAPIRFQENDAGATHAYQTFAVELAQGDRDTVLAALRERGVEATLASFALHRIPHLWPEGDGGGGGGAAGDARFPVSARLADRALALPLFPQMTEEDVRHVAAALRAALGAA
jgi:aminotransferase